MLWHQLDNIVLLNTYGVKSLQRNAQHRTPEIIVCGCEWESNVVFPVENGTNKEDGMHRNQHSMQHVTYLCIIRE